MNVNKTIIIGGGAAGMLAAIYSKLNGNDVILIEKNSKLGKKIYITGKGRCNITNYSDVDNHINNCVRNRKFMYTAMYSYPPDSIISFFESEGLKTKIERGNRVFPDTDKASDVVKVLENKINELKIKVRKNTEVTDINKVNDGFLVICGNEQIFADKVIVTTGGCSYPITGSDGKFFRVLKKLGHKITDLYPVLVPFITEENVKQFSGLTLKNVELSIPKIGFNMFGDMLFTHKGLSGPIVLTASSMFKNDKCFPMKVYINLKPALNVEMLDKRFLREFNDNINKNIENVLKSILPIKLIYSILNRACIEPYKKVNQISKEERLRLIENITKFEFTVVKTAGFSEAVITRGGVDIKEIDPYTMESKLVKGLYFAGEVIDIDSLTGGYNLQLAWSTAYLSAISQG